jgi:hypothetical protein
LRATKPVDPAQPVMVAGDPQWVQEASADRDAFLHQLRRIVFQNRVTSAVNSSRSRNRPGSIAMKQIARPIGRPRKFALVAVVAAETSVYPRTRLSA